MALLGVIAFRMCVRILASFEKGLMMTSKTERQTLLDRFQEMKAKGGLVDMKFHLGQVSETTTEAVCGQVNSLLDAVAAEKVSFFSKWNDGRVIAA
jgi:hypothetical protein